MTWCCHYGIPSQHPAKDTETGGEKNARDAHHVDEAEGSVPGRFIEGFPTTIGDEGRGCPEQTGEPTEKNLSRREEIPFGTAAQARVSGRTMAQLTVNNRSFAAA